MPSPLEAKSELTTGKHGDRGRYVTTDGGAQIFLTQDGQIGQTGKSIDGGDAKPPVRNRPESIPKKTMKHEGGGVGIDLEGRLPMQQQQSTDGPAEQPQSDATAENEPRYESPFVQSFAESIIANIRKFEQQQQQPQPTAPNPKDHPHHISKLPIPMRQSLLNWQGEISTLLNPVAWAKHGARGGDPKGVMKAAFDKIDKNELNRVMGNLSKLIAVGDQQGVNLRSFVRHNNLIPRELAAKLKPSDLFEPVRDDDRYRANTSTLAANTMQYAAQSQMDIVVDRLVAAEMGITIEEYAARRAKNSPGQMSLFGDGLGGDTPLRTSARQQRLDWDESKVKRDDDGKFATSAGGAGAKAITKNEHGAHVITQDDIGGGDDGTFDRLHAGLASEIVQSKIAIGMKGIEDREYAIMQTKGGKWQLASRKAESGKEPTARERAQNRFKELNPDSKSTPAKPTGPEVLHEHTGPEGIVAKVTPSIHGYHVQAYKPNGEKFGGARTVKRSDDAMEKAKKLAKEISHPDNYLSDQEKTERESADNASDVAGDPLNARSRNLHRAIGYQSSLLRHYERKIQRGEGNEKQLKDFISGIESEIQWYESILKDRGDYAGVGPYSDELGFDKDYVAIPKPKKAASRDNQMANKYSAAQIDMIADRLITTELGLTTEQYAARRAKNSPGQMSLFGDGLGTDAPLRTSARQQRFDWDETKVKRDPEGKFAEKDTRSEKTESDNPKEETPEERRKRLREYWAQVARDQEAAKKAEDDKKNEEPVAEPEPATEPEPPAEPELKDGEKPKAEPPADDDKGDDVPDYDDTKTPRENAESRQKKLDEDYAFARASAIGNAGEDLKGSARHKRNQWRSLEDAENNGTAEELVTRDNLLKNEPHELSAHAEDNPLISLLMHQGLKGFPSVPGYGRRRTNAEEAKKDRSDFVDAYRNIKTAAEQIAASGEDDIDTASRSLKNAVSKEIDRLRSGDYANRFNNTANALIKLSNQLMPYSRNSIASKIKEFQKEIKGDSDFSTQEKLSEAVMQAMEGKSLNQILGKKGDQKPKRFNPADLYVGIAERKGGPKIDANTAKESLNYLVDKVGLRGVQFGNSVTDAEREHHAKMSASAMLDLADVMGIPVDAIGLGGKLGLAMGARGVGSALAHYEPGTKVINLTRKKGVGSLAHEWAHAFDHEMGGGRNDGMTDSRGKAAVSFQSDDAGGVTYSSVRVGDKWTQKVDDRTGDPVWKAMDELRKSWDKSGYNSRLSDVISEGVKTGAISKSGAGGRQYWESRPEMFARTFERFVQRKLEKSDRKNTYLAGIETKAYKMGGLWPTDAEVDQMSPAFEKLFDTYREQKLNVKDRVKYSAADRAALVDMIADRMIADELGLTVDQYAARKKSQKGQQEFEWITVNADKGKGQPVMIDKKDGTIQAGMGGKFNGQKIGEIGKGGGGDAKKEASREKAKPSASSDDIASLKAKGRFTDSKGQEWQVHKSRFGTIVAHPIVDGKPQVNQDSGVAFAIDDSSKSRNPDHRTDINSVEKWENPDAPSSGSESPQDKLKQINSRMDEIANITNPMVQQEVELRRQQDKIGEDLANISWRADESEIKAMHKQQLSIRKKLDNIAAKLRPLNKEHSELIQQGSELINKRRSQEKSATKPADHTPAPQSAAPAYEPPTIPGQQTSLFGGDDLNTGQKSLFNMARPSKADQRAAKRDSAPAAASLLEQIDDEQQKFADSRKSLPGQRSLIDEPSGQGELPQFAIDAGIKNWQQAKKKGVHEAIGRAETLVNQASKSVASYLSNPSGTAKTAAKMIIEKVQFTGNMDEAVRLTAQHFERMAESNREPGHIHFAKFARELVNTQRKTNEEKQRESANSDMFMAQFEAAMIEQYRVAKPKSDKKKEPKTVIGNKGDRGRFVTTEAGDVIFIEGVVKDGYVDTSKVKARKQREKAKATDPEKFVPVSDEDKAIVQAVGDRKKDVAYFKQFVNEAHGEISSRLREDADAMRETLAQFGYTGTKLSGFLSSLKRRRDTSNIPGFDEMVDYAQKHHRQLLTARPGESQSSTDEEYMLFARLKEGFPPAPKKSDPEVINAAWGMAGIDYSGLPSEWDAQETDSEPVDDELEDAPFSASPLAAIERYAATFANAFRRNYLTLAGVRS